MPTCTTNTDSNYWNIFHLKNLVQISLLLYTRSTLDWSSDLWRSTMYNQSPTCRVGTRAWTVMSGLTTCGEWCFRGFFFDDTRIFSWSICTKKTYNRINIVSYPKTPVSLYKSIYVHNNRLYYINIHLCI